MKLSTIFRRTANQMEINESRKGLAAWDGISKAMVTLDLTLTQWYTAMQYLLCFHDIRVYLDMSKVEV